MMVLVDRRRIAWRTESVWSLVVMVLLGRFAAGEKSFLKELPRFVTQAAFLYAAFFCLSLLSPIRCNSAAPNLDDCSQIDT